MLWALCGLRRLVPPSSSFLLSVGAFGSHRARSWRHRFTGRSLLLGLLLCCCGCGFVDRPLLFGLLLVCCGLNGDLKLLASSLGSSLGWVVGRLWWPWKLWVCLLLHRWWLSFSLFLLPLLRQLCHHLFQFGHFGLQEDR